MPRRNSEKDKEYRKAYYIKNIDKIRKTNRDKASQIDPIDRSFYNYRNNDKLRGFENDLDREFISSEFSKNCIYCGESNLRMTLDRKDRSIGHIKTNCVPACVRCNYMRGTMPYEVWSILIPHLEKFRLTGILDIVVYPKAGGRPRKH